MPIRSVTLAALALCALAATTTTGDARTMRPGHGFIRMIPAGGHAALARRPLPPRFARGPGGFRGYLQPSAQLGIFVQPATRRARTLVPSASEYRYIPIRRF